MKKKKTIWDEIPASPLSKYGVLLAVSPWLFGNYTVCSVLFMIPSTVNYIQTSNY